MDTPWWGMKPEDVAQIENGLVHNLLAKVRFSDVACKFYGSFPLRMSRNKLWTSRKIMEWLAGKYRKRDRIRGVYNIPLP